MNVTSGARSGQRPVGKKTLVSLSGTASRWRQHAEKVTARDKLIHVAKTLATNKRFSLAFGDGLMQSVVSGLPSEIPNVSDAYFIGATDCSSCKSCSSCQINA
jgi:hypothetical protein